MKIGPYAKTVVAVLFAVADIAKSAITDGVFTTQELIEAGLAVLTALGVWAVPNAKKSDDQ